MQKKIEKKNKTEYPDPKMNHHAGCTGQPLHRVYSSLTFSADVLMCCFRQHGLET